MIGIEFEIDYNYKNIFKTLLNGIDIKKMRYELVQLDAYYLDDKSDITNMTIEKLIKSRKDYSVIFGNLRVFKKESTIQEIDCLKDFFDSACELIILIVDVYEVEVYFKNNELKEAIISNIDKLGIKYKIKTKDNDGRKRLYV